MAPGGTAGVGAPAVLARLLSTMRTSQVVREQHVDRATLWYIDVRDADDSMIRLGSVHETRPGVYRSTCSCQGFRSAPVASTGRAARLLSRHRTSGGCLLTVTRPTP